MTAMLSIEDLHTYYGDSYVLQGVTLELKPGQVVALLGRNGVGKTCFPTCKAGFAALPGNSAAASSRCWLRRALWWATRKSCSWTSPPRGSRR